MFRFGENSWRELRGVHPLLVYTVSIAIQESDQDFAVHDGVRTLAEQEENVRRGVSKTMKSKHLTQPDGWGHAVDLVPYVNGRLRWEWAPIYRIAEAMKKAQQQTHIELRWGGVWDKAFSELSDFEQAVSDYVERRREAGKKAFIDGPHFELMG